MALGRQARVLSKTQIDVVLGFLEKTRQPDRNKLIFLLSVRAGLRAKEIASLEWDMVIDNKFEVSNQILLHDGASKGRSGRVIPMHPEIRVLLVKLWQNTWANSRGRVILTERSELTTAQVIVNLFARWYRQIGFHGCSSHSGRRTFITNAARKISTVGGSLRDVQELAGHANLRTTQGYIDVEPEAQKRVVSII